MDAVFSKPSIETTDWVSPDASTYYQVGLSLFVFDIDNAGKATAVSPAAWRVKLTRTTSSTTSSATSSETKGSTSAAGALSVQVGLGFVALVSSLCFVL